MKKRIFNNLKIEINKSADNRPHKINSFLNYNKFDAILWRSKWNEINERNIERKRDIEF